MRFNLGFIIFRRVFFTAAFFFSGLNCGFNEATKALCLAKNPKEVLLAADRLYNLKKPKESGETFFKCVVTALEKVIIESKFDNDFLLDLQKIILDKDFYSNLRSAVFDAICNSVGQAFFLDDFGRVNFEMFLKSLNSFYVFDLLEDFGKVPGEMDMESIQNIILFLFKVPFFRVVNIVEDLGCLATTLLVKREQLICLGVFEQLVGFLLKKTTNLFDKADREGRRDLPALFIKPALGRAFISDQESAMCCSQIFERILIHFSSTRETEIGKLLFLKSILSGLHCLPKVESFEQFECLTCPSLPNISSMIRLDCCGGKRFMHRVCFRRWASSSLGQEIQAISRCPNCRSPVFVKSSCEVVNPFGLVFAVPESP